MDGWRETVRTGETGWVDEKLEECMIVSAFCILHLIFSTVYLTECIVYLIFCI